MCLGVVCILDLLESPLYLCDEHVAGEPGDAVLAGEGELRVSLTFARCVHFERLQDLLIVLCVLFWVFECSADDINDIDSLSIA